MAVKHSVPKVIATNPAQDLTRARSRLGGPVGPTFTLLGQSLEEVSPRGRLQPRTRTRKGYSVAHHSLEWVLLYRSGTESICDRLCFG